MPKNKPTRSLDVDAELRSHGLRRTAARARVLSFIVANPRPLSHGEVAKALEREGLDYATVYRNLTDLAEAGILVRRDLGDHVWRFERNPSKDDAEAHPHFVCRSCGAVTCLPDGAVKLVAPRASRAPRAVQRGAVTIELRGLCDACA